MGTASFRIATHLLGNEVTKLSTIFNDGSHVHEIFASKLKSLVNGFAKENEHVNFKLNVQDDKSASINCNYAYAYEYIAFMDALEAEISTHGVAIVIANDYRYDSQENTIFVVCDEL